MNDIDEDEWKKKLTPLQYKILREKGTESPFTGEYSSHKGAGMYSCVACETPLFSSDSKFESHSGWPSFYDIAKEGNVKLTDDSTHGMQRIEVSCATCGGHLGHLFDDGPADKTGKRYCINSACLAFKPKE